jgi:hypothetical protein
VSERSWNEAANVTEAEIYAQQSMHVTKKLWPLVPRESSVMEGVRAVLVASL